jgi:hypothetical protein
MHQMPNPWSSDQSSALLIKVCNTSMTRRNNISDRGLPCHNPHPWQMCAPGHSIEKDPHAHRGKEHRDPIDT